MSWASQHRKAAEHSGRCTTVSAWGLNSSGPLGDGTNTDSNVPVQVVGITGCRDHDDKPGSK
ncbi:hypothetical protein ACIQ7Q_05700 [Streptomyces sp. NPDC096176]|uniref:hypothetical protein n=1 Tax=Streptomyces sp. NPDC096176 TaxID=3366079 RepID=UPI003828AD70